MVMPKRKGRKRAYDDEMPRVRELIEAGMPDDQIATETGVPIHKVYEARRVLEQTGVIEKPPGEATA